MMPLAASLWRPGPQVGVAVTRVRLLWSEQQAVGAIGPARASRWRHRLAGRTWLRTPYVPLNTCAPQVTRKLPAFPGPSAIKGPSLR
jgi:hypothetical protein